MAGKGNSGVIRFQIDEFSELSTDKEHEPVEIGNLKWKFGAFSSTSDVTNNVKHLGIYLKCNDDSKSNLWSCDASIKFSLVKLNSNDKNEAYSVEFEHHFDGQNKRFDVTNFKNWEEANCYDNRFVFDKHAIVEAHININSVVGVHEKVLETFDAPKEHLTDVILVVEGKKCHVAKQILAMNSKKFYALFYQKFVENGKEEIVLEDVKYEEFIDLLNIIYPTHKTIDKTNVGHLLKLADRFIVPRVMEAVEKFLISDASIPMVDKLKYAEIYRLSMLQDACLQEMKTKENVMALEQTTNYKTLGDITYHVLLQKLMDILNNRQ